MRVLLRGYKDARTRITMAEALDRRLLGGNSGNLIFSEAAYRTLAGPSCQVDLADFGGRNLSADRVNDQYDAVVLPFANAFRPEFTPALDRFTDFIRELRVPVTVLGIGAQSDLDYGLEPLHGLREPVSRFVSAVLDRSPSIGVRGEFTERYLQSLGYGRHTEIIGCPSMFMFGDRFPSTRVPERLDPESRIAINLTPGVPHPGLVDRHLARYPRLVYVAQGRADLRLLVRGESVIPEKDDVEYPHTLDHRLYAEDRTRFFVDVSSWIAFLRETDFAFGTRIHGNIAALLAGTPAHVLAHDSRTREIAEYFDIPYSRVDRLAHDVDAADLLAGSDFEALHRDYADRFARFVGFLGEHGLKPSGIADDGSSAAALDNGDDATEPHGLLLSAPPSAANPGSLDHQSSSGRRNARSPSASVGVVKRAMNSVSKHVRLGRKKRGS